MKLNLFKKLVAVSLCSILFLGTSVNTYASEVETSVSPRYTYIDNFSMSLTAENGNEKKYKIIVSVEDLNPIQVKIGEDKYTQLTYKSKNITITKKCLPKDLLEQIDSSLFDEDNN